MHLHPIVDHEVGTCSDLDVGCRCETETFEAPSGEISVVRVLGELDLTGEPTVRAVLVDAVSQVPRHLVVDLAGLAFCSVRGFRLFTDAGSAAADRGIAVAFSGVTGHHRRVMATVGGLSPSHHPSVAAAVLAIRAQHVPRPAQPRRATPG